eukprot:TRINITY_DN14357_c0_g1_i3.p1 TRINITY_DN14357_c0_g1~~TRINITY_DN14357_c0_g1_i3.p1  ORF type:complete len:231 (+),score=67.07 TRINITY_DN14357_c0_g1_i3:649-1341(+)
MYGSVEKSSMHRILQDVSEIHSDYQSLLSENEEAKTQSLADLQQAIAENDTQALRVLSAVATERMKEFKGVVSATQAKVFTCLQADAKGYVAKVLNATKAGLAIYSALLLHSDFVDEVGSGVKDKKHVKTQSVTISKKKSVNAISNTQKWKGLPQGTFEISSKLMTSCKELEDSKKINSYTEDLVIEKAAYNLALMKQRDESFKRFQAFFDSKVNHYASCLLYTSDAADE